MPASAEPVTAQAGLQNALARLLTSQALLDLLAAGQTGTLQTELGLTRAEMDTLLSAGVPNLCRFARRLRTKRIRLVAALMPVTTAELLRRHGAERVAAEFWSHFPPTVRELGWETRERHMEWCRRYAQGLSSRYGPAWLGELARYEEALERARRGIPPDPPPADGADGSAPCLRQGVRLATFSYDVISLHTELSGATDADGPLPDRSPRSTRVAITPAANAGVTVCRLGPVAYAVLQMCTGHTPLTRIVALALPDEPTGRATAVTAEVIRQATRAGLILPGSATR
jgi:hypothetical protein